MKTLLTAIDAVLAARGKAGLRALRQARQSFDNRCVVLESDFYECERGNVLLTDDSDFNAWIDPGDDRWLEVAFRHDNYPALTVQMVSVTIEQLAQHINENFCNGMWYAKKLNLGDATGAVNVVGGVVCGDEEALIV